MPSVDNLNGVGVSESSTNPGARVQQFFDRQSTRWTAKYAPDGDLQYRINRFTSLVQMELAPGASVLDFGCGTGHITAALNQAGYEVRGLDCSRGMVSVARRTHGDAISFDTLAPNDSLDFPSASFDAIVASSVFEYLTDPVAWLRELARVTKVSGWIFLTVPNPDHIIRRLEKVEKPLFRGLRPLLPTRLKRMADYFELSLNRMPLIQWQQLLDDAGWQFEQFAGLHRPLAMVSARRATGEITNSQIRNRKKVFICSRTYLPGYKSGGPVRALSNMVHHLGDEFGFYIITRDRDVGDKKPYARITPNNWHRVGKAMVLYCSGVHLRAVRKAIRECCPDAIYLNSYYESFTRRFILLRRFRFVPDVPVLIAPRGEFASEAMRIKPVRKARFRAFAKLLRLYRGMRWQASSENELADLLRAKPAVDFRPEVVSQVEEFGEAPAECSVALSKQPGELGLAFIARISPMKNVEHLFRSLIPLRGNVEVNLYGPVAASDNEYWRNAQRILAELPANVVVQHHGAVDHAEVRGILQQHHFMILPTRGENFCHSAVEAFSAGVPVILSDATPWHHLEPQRAGFDIPLNDPQQWVSVLQRCIDMGPSEYDLFREGARQYRLHINEDEIAAKHRELLQKLVSSGRPGPHQL